MPPPDADEELLDEHGFDELEPILEMPAEVAEPAPVAPVAAVLFAASDARAIGELVAESLRALQTSQEQAREVELTLLSNKTVSLVCHVSPADHVPDVFYVIWTDACNRMGRRVNIDIAGGARLPGPTKPQSYEGCRVIVNVCKLTVSLPGSRPLIPSWCQTLRRHEQTLLYVGPYGSPGDKVACVACQVLGCELEAFEVYRCQTCDSAWHYECARRGGATPTFEFTCGVCLNRAS